MDTNETIAQRQQREWRERAFTGSGAFNDGVTPEMVAAKEQAVADEVSKRQAKLDKKLQRENYIASKPLLRIARELSNYQFENALTPSELDRARLLGSPTPEGKAARKGFNFWLRFFRAQFYAGYEMRVICTRKIHDVAAVARLADMARYVFWKYRKPGYLDVTIEPSDLNFSENRLYNDLQCEPGAMKLLEEYRDELLNQGIFKENPLADVSKKTARARKRYKHTETILLQLEEQDKRIGELAQRQIACEQLSTPNEETIRQVVDVAMRAHGEKLESHISHVATALPVTIQAMNKLQEDNEPFQTPHQPAQPMDPGWHTTCESNGGASE